ncbi:DJ-1/PfpI family protein [bacterium]|nr:DJ-1/PfpI family protein [bacterium]
MDSPKNVAILIFDDVEVLDFCGPFEVFSVAGRRDNSDLFNVYTVAESSNPVFARNKLSVNPSFTLDDLPKPDILIVPGGYGTRREMHNSKLVQWVRERAAEAEMVLSVCTGALLLAKAELLTGLKATTHHGALDLLKEVAPNTEVIRERFVDNGKVILSAGISAGIDTSLYVVEKLHGRERAVETAEYMEYDWRAAGE